jgi:hypothetical protein
MYNFYTKLICYQDRKDIQVIIHGKGDVTSIEFRIRIVDMSKLTDQKT